MYFLKQHGVAGDMCSLNTTFSLLSELMSCKLMLSLCYRPLSGVHLSFHPSFRPSFHPSFHPSIRPSVLLSVRPSVRPSVNFGGTNLDGKTYRVHMWSVDNLGEWLLPILELGHSALICGFCRAKFTFPMYFNGNKIHL